MPPNHEPSGPAPRARSFAQEVGAEPSSRPDRDLETLLEDVAAGDARAFSELYDRTCDAVYGLTWRILGDAAGAEEASHDAYLQIHRAAGGFDASRGSALTWMLVLARSRALDLRRRQARSAEGRLGCQGLPEELELADGSFVDAELRERQRLVRGALQRVTPEEREAIGEAFFHGLSHREIADRLKVPLGTIKSRIRSGMSKMRQILGPLEAGC